LGAAGAFGAATTLAATGAGAAAGLAASAGGIDSTIAGTAIAAGFCTPGGALDFGPLLAMTGLLLLYCCGAIYRRINPDSIKMLQRNISVMPQLNDS
jgi:hypothetical protein